MVQRRGQCGQRGLGQRALHLDGGHGGADGHRFPRDLRGKSYSLIGLSRDLPWQITGVQASFSEPVTASSTSLTGSGISISSFSGSGTSTLTWTLSTSLTLGSFSAVLATNGSAGIVDLASNALAAANTSENFRVLYGDFDGDGTITGADISGINAAIGAAYNIFADLNGDGVVNASDTVIARSRLGKKLS